MGILRDVTLHFIRQCFPALFNKLHVSLSRGHVDSTDVVLSKSDPISVSGIPLQIIDGKVSGLSLQLPWMNRFGATFSVKIKSIRIHLAEVPFPTLQELVFNALTDEMRRKKFRFVAEVESNQAPFGSSVRPIVSRVLDRIDLQVEDFTAVVEFADGFIATFRVAKLLARRSESNSTERFRKLVVSIEGISACIESSSRDVAVPLNIPDFSISLGIGLDEDTLKVDLDVSRIVEFSVHSSLRECVHSLKLRRLQWRLAHKWGRPSSCVGTGVATWMRYAYRRVSASHHLLHVRMGLKGVRRSLRSFVEYKNLHVKRLHKSGLKTEEIDRIAELENLFDEDMILLLRHAAKRDVAADEAFQFGRSEWLRWILFGHQMSSERERLTADVRHSLELELSTSQVTNTNSTRKGDGSDQSHCERYAFHCRLNELSGRLSEGTHEIETSLRGLGFCAGLDADTGHYKVESSLEDLMFSIDGDVFAQKQPLVVDGAGGEHDAPLMDARFSHASEGVSSHVQIHSISFVLQPRIMDSCSSVLQQWTSPLLPVGFDGQEYRLQGCTQDSRSRSHGVAFPHAEFTIGNIHMLLFDDSIAYNGRSPSLTIVLRQTVIRQPPSLTSFAPEVSASLHLQGTEFDVHSGPNYFAVSTVGDSCFPSDREQFISFSTEFRLAWTPTVTVHLNNALGFIRAPVVVRVISKLWTSRSSQVGDMASSEEGDEIDVRTAPEAVCDTSNMQDHFSQPGLQVIISFLKLNFLRDPQPLDHVLTLEVKQWETALASPSFFLVSVRIGSIHLSSSGNWASFLMIEPASNFQYAVRLKRGSHPQIGGHFFEVLIGDVSSHLYADFLLAVTAFISETVGAAGNIRGRVHKVSSPGAGEHQSIMLLSLLVASLELRWSDGQLHAKVNCSDFQVNAEGSKISASAETVTLTELEEGHDTSLLASEVILHATDPIRTVNPAVRFLCKPAGIHIDLNNLTASAKRSFWDPLVLSIADVLERLEEQHNRKNFSTVEVRQSDDDESPLTIGGSGITVILPMSQPEQSQIYSDISRVIVHLRSGLQRLSFGRTAVWIKHIGKEAYGSHRSQPEENTRILQAGDFDIQHTHQASLRDAETVVRYFDNWELNVPNALDIELSPQSLLALRIGIGDLLSPYKETEYTKAAQYRKDTRADTPSTVMEQSRVIFRGSVKSLRLSLGIGAGDINSEPFAEIEVKEICLSNAEVRDRVGADICDVVVSTWLVSCSTFQLLQYKPGASAPWRILVGGDDGWLPHYFSSHGPGGALLRVVSRQDHGRNATTYDVHINDVSVLYDSDLYTKLSQFMTECFRLLNAVRRETLGEIRETQDGECDHHDRGMTAMSDPSHTPPKASCSGSTSGDQRVAPRQASSAKIVVAIANVSLFCLSDEVCNSVHCVTLHIRKAGAALLMSNLMQPMNGSTIRLEGISFCVNANDQNTIRILSSTGAEQSSENGTPASRERSEGTNDYMHSGSSSFSPGFPHPVYSMDKLVTTVGGVRATLMRSQEDEMVLSIGKVSIDTSTRTLLGLAELATHCGLGSPDGAQNFSYNNVIAPLRLRVHMQCFSLRLSMDVSSSDMRSESEPKRGSMRVDVSVSVHCVIDSYSHTSHGTVKMSVDISDNTAGHLDQLVSPCLVRYHCRRMRECTIEVEIRQLLRLSLSPLTLRMASALNAALQSSGLLDSTPDAPSALPEEDSRLIVHVHGIAVRCLSDVPRIQVFRLLLGEFRCDAVLTVTSATRILDFSIREFLLEDTISWRLFRRDQTDSSSRRWERIVASVPRPDDESVPFFSLSLDDLQMGDMRLYTTRVLHQNNGFSTRPALRCHVAWRDYFEDLKVRIGSTGADVNLDLVALPVILEWFRSLVREIPPEDDSKLRGQGGSLTREESQQFMQSEPWFSEVHLEPLTITGGLRAAPRRLQESIYERMLTYMLNVDSVTGLTLYLPAVHIPGKHESLTTILHEVLSAYYTMSSQFLWQILRQSGRLTRLVRLLAVSLFRQRSYNPLRLSSEKTTSVNKNRRPVGLLAALDPSDTTEQQVTEYSRSTKPLVVHRIGWTQVIVSRGTNLQSPSIHVIDLT